MAVLLQYLHAGICQIRRSRMMAKNILTIGLSWELEAPNMSRCFACSEIVFGNQHRLVICLEGAATERTPQDTVLCESCYNCINQKDG